MHGPRDGRSAGEPAALIVTHYWEPHVGGIERVARYHLRQLVAQGWRVAAHSTRLPRTAAPAECNGSWTIGRHRAFNPFERSISLPVPIPGPAFCRQLTATAAQSDIVIAHGHVYPTSVCAWRAARRTGRPFVVVQHNPWVDYPQPLAAIERAADRTIGRGLLHAANVVVCVSRSTEAYVKSIAPSARTVIINNGVDTDVFHPCPRTTTPTRRRFVCVRRLVPRSGVDVLISAWREAALSDWELVVIGEGPSRRALEDAGQDLANLEFRGFVTDRDLADTVRSSWASVVPTTSGEGFGLVAAESQACGTPVIATRQGGLREVVSDRHDGILVDPGSVKALARALAELAGDPELRARLAANCLERDWSWSRVGDELATTLHGVIGDSR